jgi:cell division protein ZapA
MAVVEFIIRNKKYNIACGDGEEARIVKLAENLNVRVDAISKTFGSASDSIVLAITALMMEDEIKALKDGKNIGNSNIPQPQPKAVSEEDQADKVNQALINAIEPITKYIENLANKLESE